MAERDATRAREEANEKSRKLQTMKALKSWGVFAETKRRGVVKTKNRGGKANERNDFAPRVPSELLEEEFGEERHITGSRSVKRTV